MYSHEVVLCHVWGVDAGVIFLFPHSLCVGVDLTSVCCVEFLSRCSWARIFLAPRVSNSCVRAFMLCYEGDSILVVPSLSPYPNSSLHKAFLHDYFDRKGFVKLFHPFFYTFAPWVVHQMLWCLSLLLAEVWVWFPSFLCLISCLYWLCFSSFVHQERHGVAPVCGCIYFFWGRLFLCAITLVNAYDFITCCVVDFLPSWLLDLLDGCNCPSVGRPTTLSLLMLTDLSSHVFVCRVFLGMPDV